MIAVEEIIAILSSATGVPEASFIAADDLFKGGLLDSMSTARAILEIERRSGGSLDSIDLSRYEWNTIGDFVNLYLSLSSR
jgi:acyl carrier protein